jgi:hypothetical protein
MHRIELPDLTPDDGIRLKNLLISTGLVMYQDFVWQYRTAVYDKTGYNSITPRTVTFDFEDGATATYWRLKWI